ncbi:hypothetical protein F4678DRAFT_467261 [Xylaria arbuscula]|nr:hypothetical protein F4678DRAFT_467261 [Xylaria arbuscula]
MSPTDLYVHKVRLKPNSKPWNRSRRKTWTTPQLYWLKKLTLECLDAGLYEPTSTANGCLSDWTAMPVLVAKDKDLDLEQQDPWLEPRLTVNYGKDEEDLPGMNLPLLADVHAKLSDPRIRTLSKLDLKHGYWAVLVHPDYRHILAFEIPGFPQLQPTMMPQALGPITSPDPEPSLISPESPDALISATEYIDDVFATHASIEEQLAWIEIHFLPRILWAKLKLSFGKCSNGCEEIVALGMTHKTYGRISVKADRAEKLKVWPPLKDQTEVRMFMGAIGPTRRLLL